MRSLLLIGGGGHCRSCIDVVDSCKQYSIVGVVDNHLQTSQNVLGYPVVGTDSDLCELLRVGSSALIAVGQIKSPLIRMKLFNLLESLGAHLPVIVSTKAYVSSRSTVGRGTIVMHGAIVNASASVAENCIVNTLALVEHDAVVNSHCHIATGARVNGGVQIEQGCLIGSGAVIKEGVTIGHSSIIGAGQVVLRDIPPETILKSHA